MDEAEKKDFFLKEIDIIQSVINRMASNSFLIKGWTITLVVGVFLLKGLDFQISIAIIPILMFWGLDAYFLYQEKLFRERYKWVIKNRPESNEGIFDMDNAQFKEKISKCGTLFSITLLIFYLTILGLTLLYILYIHSITET
jgi:hypothetical protein